METLKLLSEYGVLGIACVVLALALLRLYNHARADLAAANHELKQCREALGQEQTLRVDDAKRFTDVALKLQGEVISSVVSIDKASDENAKLCELVEKFLGAVERLIDQKERSLHPPRKS